MKVAEENIIRFDHHADRGVDRDQGNRAGTVYAPQIPPGLEHEHDARGLIVAVLLCVCCWAALGFFLLS
ncbi:hypothetical protein [Novosphingobium beihaiensis]|uniref:Uncharacterized protein n=1 Tax=Novosphingobium beihaiensis TaxID=2930389 RepID=A0ABT0BR41_9SPHN|nr:hypothetical protein [Novosphingobium beihaiensis]MCJ2187276.1 hypothetical protein [Novosphingobium beihaiensis]